MDSPKKIPAYVPLSEVVLMDADSLTEAMARVLSGEPVPKRPAPPFPPGHARLVEATDGALRAVVELHGPRLDLGIWWQCRGCEFGGYDGEPPVWPCGTVTLIAEQLGVDLSEDADG